MKLDYSSKYRPLGSSYNTCSLSTDYTIYSSYHQPLFKRRHLLHTEIFLIDTFPFRQSQISLMPGDRYRNNCCSRFQYIIPDIKLQIWAETLSEVITNIEKVGNSSSKYLRCGLLKCYLENFLSGAVQRNQIIINIISLSLWPLLQKNKSRDSYKIQIIFSSECGAWKPGYLEARSDEKEIIYFW